MALAHAERDEVRGAYNSALYLTPRQRMLQAWADTVMGMIDAAPDQDAAPIPTEIAAEKLLVA
jgi:hypothetical protein